MRLSWPWWRRRTPGRHELGAAVTAIASGVVPVVRSLPLFPSAIPSYAAPPRAVRGRSAAAGPVESQSSPTQPAATIRPYAAPPAVLGRSVRPVVSLGFRDGSSATLDPASLQARALQQLASSLTSTD